MVDSLEKDSLSLVENDEVVGVGKGELGVVEGVDNGGKVMTGLFSIGLLIQRLYIYIYLFTLLYIG
jgi:hypothetical protein